MFRLTSVIQRVGLLTVVNTALLIGLLVCVQLIVFVSNNVIWLTINYECI